MAKQQLADTRDLVEAGTQPHRFAPLLQLTTIITVGLTKAM
jgi:hypothetical protein